MTSPRKAIPVLLFAAALLTGAAAPLAVPTGEGVSLQWKTAQAQDKKVQKEKKEKKVRAEKQCSKEDKACNDENAKGRSTENMQKGKDRDKPARSK